MKTDKCQHRLLVVRATVPGTVFVAACRDCGLEGSEENTPAAARASFNRRLGKRYKDEEEDDAD